VNSYENIKGDPANGVKYNMIGIYTNQIEVWESFESIHEQVGGDYPRGCLVMSALFLTEARFHKMCGSQASFQVSQP